MKSVVASLLDYATLPRRARRERSRDRAGLPPDDPGIDRAVAEGASWLARAQDLSASRDGGVARHYSLRTGWSGSYPETTGYIVPTVLDCALVLNRPELRQRAKRMLDWLVSIQFPGGGFQGGMVNAKPLVPVIFNTGQILLGLARGVTEFGEAYREPMRRAAKWLVENQDSDGCWRKHRSPFAAPGETTYETHVAWALFEAARVDRESRFSDAALANVRWALQQQTADGWFDRCSLSDGHIAITHTIGYALRGVVEAYRHTDDPRLLEAARLTSDALLGFLEPDGFIPGSFRAGWQNPASWACLTGTAQIALCWLLLYRLTGDLRYRDGAVAANRGVRRTMRVDGDPDTRGAVKGSFPVDGPYDPYKYCSWGVKFLIDSCLLEVDSRAGVHNANAETSRGGSL